jgi:DNA-binding HxlR family transcriptional regulator
MTRPTITPTDQHAINAVLHAVRQASDAICDRWSLTLLLALIQGDRRFKDFEARTGQATRVLTTRLRALEAIGLIVRMPYQMHPPRHEYRLTAMGEAASEILLQMARWEQRWVDGDTPAGSLGHARCGMQLVLELRCTACGELVTAREIDWKVSRAQMQDVPEKQTVHRRSTVSGDGDPVRHVLGPTLDIFGDKWGIEILICAFFRIRRFSDFRQCTGISTNILADRLERLVAAQILRRSEEPSRQAEYRLTERGIDLYGVPAVIKKWADAWLGMPYRSRVQPLHRTCGSIFFPLTTCVHCGDTVRAEDVIFPDR